MIMRGKQLIPGLRATREAVLRGEFKISEVWVKEGRKGINIEEMQNIIFEGGCAASCTMKLDDSVSPELLEKIATGKDIIKATLT